MTLLNAFVTPERADIWSDGAYMDPDWRVRGFASKTIVLEAIPAVAAVSGDGEAGMLAYLLLRDRFLSFDNLEDGVVDVLRSVDQLRSGENRLIMFMAGWSHRHSAVRCILTSNMAEYPGLPPWGVAQVWRSMQPNPPAFLEHLRRLGIEPEAESPLSTDDAFRIAMEQRALLGLVPGHSHATAVGGFLQHTAVTKAGVYTRIAHRWPQDHIGSRITPFA